MFDQTTTTTRIQPDDDKTQFLTVEERLRFFEGDHLPRDYGDNQPDHQLISRLLCRLFKR